MLRGDGRRDEGRREEKEEEHEEEGKEKKEEQDEEGEEKEDRQENEVVSVVVVVEEGKGRMWLKVLNIKKWIINRGSEGRRWKTDREKKTGRLISAYLSM